MQDCLIERLKAVGDCVMKHAPRVNNGGCAVYAAAVAAHLADRGITTWGVLTSQLRKDDLHTVREQDEPHTLDDWNSSGVFIGHVMIQFEHNSRVWTHDTRRTTCGRVHKDSCFGERLCPGYLTIPELVTIADQPEGWNPVFRRETGIPVIQAAVRRHLRHVA